MHSRNIIYGCLLFISIYANGQSDWQLAKNDDAIEIYTRSITSSNLKEFKATTVLNTTLEVVFQKLIDAPTYTEIGKQGIGYLLKTIDEHTHIYYVKKELPWPIKDRDICTRLTVNKISENKIQLDLEGYPEALPEKENTIRIKKLTGHWLLEKIGLNRVRVTQQLYLDPEGNLPSVITNTLLVKGPLKTFKELKQVIENNGSF